MASDILSEMAEHAGIETGRAAHGKPIVISKPTFEVDSAGRFVCTWPADGLRMIAEAPERKRLEFWILLSVQYKTDDGMPRSLITKKRLNLRSVSGSAEVVRFLKGQVERDWAGRVEILSGLVDANYSAGDPMVWLDSVSDPGSIAYLADPLLEKNEHNILAGSGGSTKSFMALAMCMAYASGKQLVPGISMHEQGKALYLDWEANKESLRRRFSQFAASQKGVAYKRMQAPLADVGDELEQLIRAENFGLVVMDSASMASGGEIIDEASVARYFLTARSFKTTILTLAHVPKDKDNDNGPIGSVYWYNQARVVWKITKDQIEGDSVVRIDLVQRKSNNDMMHKPFSLELDFSGPQVVYRRADAGAADEANLPLASRVSRFLLTNGKATSAEIAEALGKSQNHVNNILRNGTDKIYGHSDAKKDRLWWALDLSNTLVTNSNTRVTSGHTQTTPPTEGGGYVLNVPKTKTPETEGDLPW